MVKRQELLIQSSNTISGVTLLIHTDSRHCQWLHIVKKNLRLCLCVHNTPTHTLSKYILWIQAEEEDGFPLISLCTGDLWPWCTSRSVCRCLWKHCVKKSMTETIIPFIDAWIPDLSLHFKFKLKSWGTSFAIWKLVLKWCVSNLFSSLSFILFFQTGQKQSKVNTLFFLLALLQEHFSAWTVNRLNAT